MNHHTLNGGYRSVIVSAIAAISCAASVTANGSRLHDALAPAYSGATMVAHATYSHRGQASVATQSDIYADVDHTQMAHATFGGRAALQAFVLRQILGHGKIEGSASILAIPASTLGHADLGGGAQLLPNATRMQFARSEMASVGQFEVVALPAVTRYVTTQAISGTGIFRAESTLNGVGDAYATFDTVANVSLPGAGFVYRLGFSELDSAADLSAQGTQVQPASARISASTFIVLAEPHIEQVPFSNLHTTASVHADAVRLALVQAQVIGASTVRAQASVLHGSAQSVWQGGAQVHASAGVNRFVHALVSHGTASLHVQATRHLVPTVVIQAQGGVVANGLRLRAGVATPIIGVAGFEAHPDITIRLGEVKVLGSSGIRADAVRELFAESQVFTSEASIRADMWRITLGSAHVFGSAEILADTKMNLSSFDPPARTFIRPALDTHFSRPSGDTLFRRAA